MKKILLILSLLITQPSYAAGVEMIILKVENLKTSETEVLLKFPLWAIKAGISFTKYFKYSNQNSIAIVNQAINLGQKGVIMEIEDYKSNEKVSFVLE